AYDSRVDYQGAESAAECRELLLSALDRRRTTEIERGLTLHGPGRDDLSLMIGTHPAKGYASHGETWSLALAMQLAGWDLLSADADSAAEQPVLVLDDVFAELDTGRRSRLASRITAAEQVFITASVDSDLPEGLEGTRIDESTLLTGAVSGAASSGTSPLPSPHSKPSTACAAWRPARRSSSAADDAHACAARSSTRDRAVTAGIRNRCRRCSVRSSPIAAGPPPSTSARCSDGGPNSSEPRSPSTPLRSISHLRCWSSPRTRRPGRPSCGCSNRRSCADSKKVWARARSRRSRSGVRRDAASSGVGARCPAAGPGTPSAEQGRPRLGSDRLGESPRRTRIFRKNTEGLKRPQPLSFVPGGTSAARKFGKSAFTGRLRAFHAPAR